jgi:hypothetical protein
VGEGVRSCPRAGCGKSACPVRRVAIRYGRHGGRRASDNFTGADPHEAGRDLEYFVWVARRSDRVFVIDAGFNPTSAAQRGRTILRLPADGVRAMGIEATYMAVIARLDRATQTGFNRSSQHFSKRRLR